MTFKGYRCLSAVLIGLLAVGCDNAGQTEQPEAVSVEIEIDEEDLANTDQYQQIDDLAFAGVKKADIDKALSGDGPTAVALGNAFAEAHHLTEARFWYQIAAENGDSIGMNNFSVLVRDFNCHRANFWMRKALETGGLGRQREASMRTSLKEYLDTCK